MRDLGPAWHGIVGIVIGCLAIFGFSREVFQHDLTLSPWQLLEACAWPLGGLAAVGVGSVVLKLMKRGKDDGEG